MGKENLSEFKIDPEWKQDGGAAILIAHPDDEMLISWMVIRTLVAAGISMTVLTLTLGELGETKDKPDVSPDEMRKIRESEFKFSSDASGLQGFTMNFPDTDLSRPDIKEQAKHDVLEFVREEKFGVIFSFHPFEITPEFDHPDHNAVGEIARYVSAVSAVKNLHTKSDPLENRPSLYLWTSNPDLATDHILFTQQMEDDRKTHLADYYSSQFPKDFINRWGVIFDGIARGMRSDLPAQEMFTKAR